MVGIDPYVATNEPNNGPSPSPTAHTSPAVNVPVYICSEGIGTSHESNGTALAPAPKRSHKRDEYMKGELKFERKEQDVDRRCVVFDESAMPPPVCSCTGRPQRCYKWGRGGWQSSCCTPTMSLYPLPFLPVKRHGRVGGRKMSGGAFGKLLARAAADGHDLSTPLDLKDHWAKHGTNGWITIK